MKKLYKKYNVRHVDITYYKSGPCVMFWVENEKGKSTKRIPARIYDGVSDHAMLKLTNYIQRHNVDVHLNLGHHACIFFWDTKETGGENDAQ